MLAMLAAVERNVDMATWLRPELSPSLGFEFPSLGSTTPGKLGLLDLLAGAPDTAVEHLEQALVIERVGGPGPCVAWTCSDCAEAYLAREREGDRERAAERAREALAIAERLGMHPLRERVLRLSVV